MTSSISYARSSRYMNFSLLSKCTLLAPPRCFVKRGRMLATRLVTEAVELIMRPSSIVTRCILTSFSNIQSLDKPG